MGKSTHMLYLVVKRAVNSNSSACVRVGGEAGAPLLGVGMPV